MSKTVVELKKYFDTKIGYAFAQPLGKYSVLFEFVSSYRTN